MKKKKDGKTMTLCDQAKLQLSSGMMAGVVIEADEALALQSIRQAAEACRLGTPVVINPSDPDLPERLEAHKNSGVGVVVIPDLLRIHGNNPQVMRAIREFALYAKPSGGAYPRLILIEQPGIEIPLGIRGDIGFIIAELPTVEELKLEIKGFLKVNESHGVKLEGNGEMLGVVANALTGVPRHTAGKLLTRCWAENGSIDPAWLSSAKAELVKEQSGKALEFIDTTKAATLGGADIMRAWLDKARKTFTSDKAKSFGLEEPKGILIVGIPGTGKSLTPKNVARAWGAPLIRFDIRRVFGGLVGQTEEQLVTALRAIEACAPCILWIDEIEKALGGKGDGPQGDSGVSEGLAGTLLTWLQENTKPIFVVATANSVNALRPELLRKGRLDENFFMDLPDLHERNEILGIHMALKDRPEFDGGKGNGVSKLDADAIARASHGYSGAELEEVLKEGMKSAFAKDRAVTTEDVLAALKATTPLSKTKAEDVSRLREWAKTHATFANERSEAEPPSAADGGLKRPGLTK